MMMMNVTAPSVTASVKLLVVFVLWLKLQVVWWLTVPKQENDEPGTSIDQHNEPKTTTGNDSCDDNGEVVDTGINIKIIQERNETKVVNNDDSANDEDTSKRNKIDEFANETQVEVVLMKMKVVQDTNANIDNKDTNTIKTSNHNDADKAKACDKE